MQTPSLPTTRQSPDLETGAAVWVGSQARVNVRFLGRSPAEARAEALAISARAAPVVATPAQLAWLRQIHSADVLEAAVGECGTGDALRTSTPGLALAVATADCVPILIASREEVAAVHAGWRGIVGGVVENALRSFGAPASTLEAWIGPAIGPCCYEVGEEVAAQIVAASAPSVAVAGSSRRPHLDLQAAVREQLRRVGVASVHTFVACTRCHSEWLWSYRRDGQGAGRNLAFIWLASET